MSYAEFNYINTLTFPSLVGLKININWKDYGTVAVRTEKLVLSYYVKSPLNSKT